MIIVIQKVAGTTILKIIVQVIVALGQQALGAGVNRIIVGITMETRLPVKTLQTTFLVCGTAHIVKKLRVGHLTATKPLVLMHTQTMG